ncbi:MAG: CDP-alcohol phosphatidyltransferase family protein [Conexivisphaerales archaeon]
MLTRIRQLIKPALDSLGRALSKISPNPNTWTALGLLISLASAYFFYESAYFPASLLLLASGFMDVADGAVAKSTGRVSKRGGFLDSNFDRVAEVAIYLALILSSHDSYFTFVSALALSFSLLVSYSRSRAEAAGINAEGVGYGERAERLLILAAGGIAGYLFYAIILVALLSFITYLQRLYVYSSRLEQSQSV